MKKMLFFVMISAIFSSCITNRATVVTTATTAPIRTITTVADVNVSDNRISYTYIPSKADAKRLSKTQLLNNAIYMALKNNGNADVLLQINYYITKRNVVFVRRINSITVSGYPAKYTNFRKPTKEDYENFERLPQNAKDPFSNTAFFGRIFHKKK